MSKTPMTNQPIINEALNLDGSPEAVRRFYDRWAEHYDRDLADLGYAGPQIIAKLFEQNHP